MKPKILYAIPLVAVAAYFGLAQVSNNPLNFLFNQKSSKPDINFDFLSSTAQKSAATNPEILQKLAEKRIVYIGQEIDDELASEVIALMLYFDDIAPEEDIFFYINSPGGSVTSGMAIYDTIQDLRSDVVTICVDFCASMAALLLTVGAPEKRLALPDARMMIHNPSNNVEVPADPAAAAEIAKFYRQIHEIFSRSTGQPIEKIERDMEQDFFLSAQQAQEYGLIDTILQK